MAPHAGHRYSGVTAGALFGAVVVPLTCIVLAPNHTGRCRAREGGSILLSRRYQTPLGEMATDVELGDRLVAAAAGLLEDDPSAHAEEHAVEVVLPFIQVANPASRLVPIVLGWGDWPRCERLASALHTAIGARADVLVVASSDMNHYAPADVTRRKDALALARLEALDGAGLLETTERERISMCGRIPAACACQMARLAGSTTGEVIAYSHSGAVSGDRDRVVGYAGVLLGVAAA
jgi:AmmeMemoRadiSam system protein B